MNKRKRRSSERLERNERACEMKWERKRKRDGQIRKQMIGCWERDPTLESRKYGGETGEKEMNNGTFTETYEWERWSGMGTDKTDEKE